MAGTVVCKIGGSVIDGINPTIIDDIKDLRSDGGQVVLVHGGGDQVTAYAERMGKKQQFITSPDGIRSRFTDQETAEIFSMVMSGLLAKKIAQSLEKNGIDCLTLSGIDGMLLRADRKKKLIVLDERGRKVAIEGGFTGKIKAVNTSLLNTLIEASYVPVVSPVAVGDQLEFLNVDGDRACSHVAGALKADAAVFLTDAEGLILDNALVNKLTPAEGRSALPRIGPGMDKKIIAAVEAVEMGAKKSVIASGLKEHPLQAALKNEGTVIA